MRGPSGWGGSGTSAGVGSRGPGGSGVAGGWWASFPAPPPLRGGGGGGGPRAFWERTPLYKALSLSEGAEWELDAALERLVERGYGRVDRVSRPGDFGGRGGIVDFSRSTRRSPVRVEWWGDEIESVRAISLATQRVVRELENVTVYAAREGDLATLAAGSYEDLPDRKSTRLNSSHANISY